MKVLMLNGSPNEKGCTYTALNIMAQVFEGQSIQNEIFWIGNGQNGGCIACRKCAQLKECFIQDGVNNFRKKAAEANAFVFASPVHYAAASGNITGFLDRLFFSDAMGNANANFRLKPAAVVASARRGGTTAALDQLAKYPAISEMPIITSSYWNMVHGHKPEEMLQDAEGVFTMENLARNMAYFLKCIRAAGEQGIVAPAKEQKVWTNFIR